MGDPRSDTTAAQLQGVTALSFHRERCREIPVAEPPPLRFYGGHYSLPYAPTMQPRMRDAFRRVDDEHCGAKGSTVSCRRGGGGGESSRTLIRNVFQLLEDDCAEVTERMLHREWRECLRGGVGESVARAGRVER